MPRSARDFAVWAHGDQKYGERPYVEHLDEVAEIVRGIPGLPEFAVTVAYLHDVVEDTDITLRDVERWFGPQVCSCVRGLTDPPGDTRRERKARLHGHLRALLGSGTGRVTLAVKAADRLANVRSSVSEGKEGLVKMYADEHDDFRDAAYRAGLCDAVWAELDSLISGSSS